ncbi:MAG: energy transducer TonB [Candidatus Rokuibacteriota bacterium]
MTAVAIPLGSRTRRSMGPALGRARVPVIATVVSAIVHTALAAAVMLSASAWAARQPKVYVINLVPAVTARGAPEVRPTPALPPRPDEVAPRAAPTPPADLPARETPSPDMPPRDAARTASDLPDRTVPARRPALPRAGDKELPTVPSAPSTKPAPEPAAPPRPQAAAAPPPPLGRPSGSALGSGAVTLNVSDFPFAWYTRVIVNKVTDGWAARALEGRQPVAVFEIGRDGQVSKLSIEKSSGNPYYDQAALRAITSANPFPPLPPDFKEPVLRVHMGFNFASERG